MMKGLRLRRWIFNYWTSIEPHKVVLLQISVALLTVTSNSVTRHRCNGLHLVSDLCSSPARNARSASFRAFSFCTRTCGSGCCGAALLMRVGSLTIAVKHCALKHCALEHCKLAPGPWTCRGASHNYDLRHVRMELAA
jgi:hypothetical protein